MTSAERFVHDARKSLSLLVGRGAASASTEAPKTWLSFGQRARALGLRDLGDRCERLAKALDARGALAFEASPDLADAALAIFDRVEALASTLTLWSVEEQLESSTRDHAEGNTP